jgi:hypothetical protein
MIPGLD